MEKFAGERLRSVSPEHEIRNKAHGKGSAHSRAKTHRRNVREMLEIYLLPQDEGVRGSGGHPRAGHQHKVSFLATG